MAKLALKGHPTRGSEVITFLEMLGGHQCGYPKEAKTAYWFIDRCSNIVAYDTAPTDLYNDLCIFTLEEFETKFPYKIGDKVKSPKYIGIITDMYWSTIDNCVRYRLSIKNDVDRYFSADVLRPYKEQELMNDNIPPYMDYDVKTENDMEEHKGTLVEIDLTRELRIADKVRIVLGDYEVKEEGGETYLVRKKPEYPQTYEECCGILKIEYPYFKTEEDGISASVYKNKLIGNFKRLLIRRDAYWKIAGEQMGLGKPWQPDFTDTKEMYYIFYKGYIEKGNQRRPDNHILIFPTPEMRDAFKESKEISNLIEQCKDLL